MVEAIDTKFKIAFLGPEGSFSHKAAREIFSDNVDYELQEDLDSVIKAVKDGKVDKGIIPFFNPYEEHIRECQESLFEADLIATNVAKIDINLNLASNRLGLTDIQYVYSKDHVFKQCDVWLRKNLPDVIKELAPSTSKAAEDIKSIPGAAAICSLEAIAKYELSIVTENIQNPKNFTLFFVIEKKEAISQWGNYSFFCFKLRGPDEKMHILNILEIHHLRSSQKWDFPHLTEKHYLFFLEFFGCYRDLNTVAFEADCKKYFQDFKLIGSFDSSITKLLAKI